MQRTLKRPSAISLLHSLRSQYCFQQTFHKRMFMSFALILFLDIIIIIYVRAITLDVMAWSGIIFLIVLMMIEGIQYIKYKELKESVDDFYLVGEYETQRQNK